MKWYSLWFLWKERYLFFPIHGKNKFFLWFFLGIILIWTRYSMCNLISTCFVEINILISFHFAVVSIELKTISNNWPTTAAFFFWFFLYIWKIITRCSFDRSDPILLLFLLVFNSYKKCIRFNVLLCVNSSFLNFPSDVIKITMKHLRLGIAYIFRYKN